jgi:septum formation protein
MQNGKLQFILASASPRRKELIGHLNVPYRILSLNIPEESSEKDPAKFCLDIARQKGRAVFNDLLRTNSTGSYFVVSADTIVSLGDKIYGKPKDVKEAGEILMELSGKKHSVFTAVSVIMLYDGKETTFSFAEETKVTFNSITPHLLKQYLATGDSLDKAGAYGIQNASLTFISRVEGDYANVVGFPLSRFIVEAETFLNQTFQAEDPWDTCFR